MDVSYLSSRRVLFVFSIDPKAIAPLVVMPDTSTLYASMMSKQSVNEE
jgi:hypothetical protein